MGVGKGGGGTFTIAKKWLCLGISHIFIQKAERIPLRMVYKHKQNRKEMNERKLPQKNFFAASGWPRQTFFYKFLLLLFLQWKVEMCVKMKENEQCLCCNKEN